MNTAEKLTRELSASGDTAFAFFSKCWEHVFKNKCASNVIVIDANNYGRNGKVPYYVHRYFEKLAEAERVLPGRTARLHSMFGLNREPFHMVDVSPVLYARRGKDGVWRTSS